MKLHHIGIATADINNEVMKLSEMFPVVGKSEIVHDEMQNADICMLEIQDGSRIELISGQTVEGYLKKRIKLYHVCYEVEDLRQSVMDWQKTGAVVMSPPKKAVLFNGREVVFLMTNMGVVELLQADRIENIIKEYRKERLKGSFCYLKPIDEGDLENVIVLRNKQRNKYFLNQKKDITLEEQIAWYRNYVETTNDIYWGVWNYDNKMIGTIRLYSIQGMSCEEGSCIIDEEYARRKPYAIEAKYLTTEFAFNVLGVKTMINENRVDNKEMNSLSKQIGYCFLHNVEINGVLFNYFVLSRENYKRDKIVKILAYWKNR